ncbi:MAG TPA: Ig-like domain repeat protein, partial [Tahibacter sp.]|nr:Ig-like domain repeat protein [Tahibacter sp.]
LRGIARACALVALFAAAGAHAQSRAVVTSAADSGPGTLRAAIDAANANADRTTIDFAIAGTGPFTIALATPLPNIATPVVIRGFTQPGSVAPTAVGNGTYRIEINVAPKAERALLFIRGSERSAVTGLAITGGQGTSSPQPAIWVLANDVRVSANLIGLHADGTPERYDGVGIAALACDKATIGGTASSDGNVINGTNASAIMLVGTGHVVRNNWIGMTRDGIGYLDSAIIGNGLISGAIAFNPPPGLLSMYDASVQKSFLGLRDSTIADNLFAHTLEEAIVLLGTNNLTANNTIDRNIFGRDVWLTSLPYVDVAIRLSRDASRNRIRDNLVYRANAGILLGDARPATPTLAGEGNLLSGNLFHEVAYAAIGLDANAHFAPLANDPLDRDAGPNALQNKPQLTLGSAAGGIEGVLDAEPGKEYTIEFFLGAACRPAGGVAEFPLGRTTVRTDGAGRVAFSAGVQNAPFGGLRAGDVVSATATDIATGNTSELADCVTLQPAIVPDVKTPKFASPIPAMDTSLRLEATVTGNGSRLPTGDVTFSVDTATGRQVLGRVALASAQASLPTPPSGWFVNPGRYAIVAEYSGDGFHAPARSVVQTVVVFRPAVALFDPGLSSPVRRDLSSGDREYYVAPMRTWRRFQANADDTWIDADRFAGNRLDAVLVQDSRGAYALIDGLGARSAVTSSVLGGATILDLLQFDAGGRADAIVRDANARYALVRCVFVVDLCEKKEFLDVNPEYRFVLSGEFNGDGHADLAWLDPGANEIEIWLMGDDIKPLARYRAKPPGGHVLAAAADVDVDGYDDLVWLDSANASLVVGIMDSGRVARDVRGSLPSAGWETPGAVQVGQRGDADYGAGQLVWRDTTTGEAVIWRDTSVRMGYVTANPQSLYFDPAFTVERTR